MLCCVRAHDLRHAHAQHARTQTRQHTQEADKPKGHRRNPNGSLTERADLFQHAPPRRSSAEVLQAAEEQLVSLSERPLSAWDGPLTDPLWDLGSPTFRETKKTVPFGKQSVSLVTVEQGNATGEVCGVVYVHTV